MSNQSVLSGSKIDGFGSFLVAKSQLTREGNLDYIVELELTESFNPRHVKDALDKALAVFPNFNRCSLRLYRVSGSARLDVSFRWITKGRTSGLPADQLFEFIEDNNRRIDQLVEKAAASLVSQAHQASPRNTRNTTRPGRRMMPEYARVA